ncbi:MAG TPA: DUF2277 domain-containing protein [Dehalococcoidia bacterium]|nr:DUF2277 domain-containing protein [Dehalococcoidia bacterium]
MCRSIKTLRSGATIATPEEVEAAALQFVRKISGFRKPTSRHEEAFNTAVREISEVSVQLLDTLSATLSANGRAS